MTFTVQFTIQDYSQILDLIFDLADYFFKVKFTDPMVQWLRLPTANPEVLSLNPGFR
jgi:hypothetical protein